MTAIVIGIVIVMVMVMRSLEDGGGLVRVHADVRLDAGELDLNAALRCEAHRPQQVQHLVK